MELYNENICRLCLSQADILLDIFDSRPDIKTPHKIYVCTNLQVEEGDGYPNFICDSCKLKLNDAFQFRTDCIRSYAILNNNRSQTEFINIRHQRNKKSNSECQVETKNSENKVESNAKKRRKKRSIVGLVKRGCPKKDTVLPSKRISSRLKCRDKLKTQNIGKMITDIPNEKCNICRKTFKSIGYLSHHMRVHTGLRPYQCKVCRKTFSQNSALIVHSRGHSGDKPYICNLCGKGFTQSGNLAVHYRSHTGERPFQCDICAKSFSQVGNLYIHKRIHTGERQYECDICDKAFKFPSHLAEHARIHSIKKQYQCSICEKGFHKRSYLSTHMRIHTGEKPYKCEHCEKSFSNSSNLAAHKRIHTGSKPYVCTECNKGFTQSSALVRHTKQHKKLVLKSGIKMISNNKPKNSIENNTCEVKSERTVEDSMPTVIINERSRPTTISPNMQVQQMSVVYAEKTEHPGTFVIKENKQSVNLNKSCINKVAVQNISILKRHQVKDVSLVGNNSDLYVVTEENSQHKDLKIVSNSERVQSVIDNSQHLLTFQSINENSKIGAYKLYQVECNANDTNTGLLYDTVNELPYEMENNFSVFERKKMENAKINSPQAENNWRNIDYVSRNPFYVEYQSDDDARTESNIRLVEPTCDYQGTSSVNSTENITYALVSPDLKGNEVNVINFVQSSDHQNAGHSERY